MSEWLFLKRGAALGQERLRRVQSLICSDPTAKPGDAYADQYWYW